MYSDFALLHYIQLETGQAGESNDFMLPLEELLAKDSIMQVRKKISP